MTTSNVSPGRPARSGPPAVGGEVPAKVDAALLRFVASMYGVQLNQLAALLEDKGAPTDRAAALVRDVVARWQAAGYVDTGQLTLGEPWVWASRKGLDACGLKTRLVKPATHGLRHTHAVTDVRLAVERTTTFRQGGARWRAERLIVGGLESPGRPEHIPDGEVHWSADGGSPWAGEVWAVEVEITRKSIEHTAKIMHEVLTKTGEFGSPGAIAGPGTPPRYARLVYVSSKVAVGAALGARGELGLPLAARIDVHDLPESALRLNTPKQRWEP